MEVIGGRSVHPVNVRVGGFYRMPTAADLRPLRPVLEQALEDAVRAVALVGDFDFPDLEQPHEYLSLRAEVGYPLESGSVVTSSGHAFAVRDFLDHVERDPGGALPRPARQPRRRRARPLRRRPAGPLQPELRPAVGARPGTPPATPGSGPTCRNPFRSIVVRAVEMVEAFHEAIRDRWTRWTTDGARGGPGAGPGGRRGTARQRGAAGPALPPVRPRRGGDRAGGPDHPAHLAEPGRHRGRPAGRWSRRGPTSTTTTLQHRCEQAIRNYDPCISCATHFLDLTVERQWSR